MGTIYFKYTAESIEDLANYLEQQAKEIGQRAETRKTQKAKALDRAESFGMQLAADIVRNTKIRD